MKMGAGCVGTYQESGELSLVNQYDVFFSTTMSLEKSKNTHIPDMKRINNVFLDALWLGYIPKVNVE